MISAIFFTNNGLKELGLVEQLYSTTYICINTFYYLITTFYFKNENINKQSKAQIIQNYFDHYVT
jgi:hypothetical protein